MENTTQYEIQEQILKKLDGLSTDQLSYLSVLVDQIKDSNSTLVSIKEGLEGATIYKDKIVKVPEEKIVYKDKIVIVPEDAAKLKDELKQKNMLIDYYKQTVEVCDKLIEKMEPWWHCAFKDTDGFYDQFFKKKNIHPKLVDGICGLRYPVFEPKCLKSNIFSAGS